VSEAIDVVYLTDTMVGDRMVSGLAERTRLNVVAPRSLAGRVTNWPDQFPESVQLVLLPGNRAGFIPRAARWLAGPGRRHDVCYVLDNLTCALAGNIGRRLGGPPTVLQLGRPTVAYIRCARPQGPLRARLAHVVRLFVARALVTINERWADAVAPLSDAVARDVAGHARLVRKVPWYGVDTGRFRRVCDRAEAAGRLGLPLDAPIVMYRSRIAPEKDPKTFLAAVARLRAQGRRIHAVYMGGEHEEFARLARAAGVGVIARDATSLDEIPIWYCAADVCVQTSKEEGLCLSVLEAEACGTPVVATDVGGLREALGDGAGGLLVPPRDAEAVADAVARLIDDPELAAELGRRGREHVQCNFEASRTFDSWVQLGVEVAAEHGRRRRSGAVSESAAASQLTRVLFVDHETRLSGGQRDLVDLVGALDKNRVDVHVAVPAEGPLAEALRQCGSTVHLVPMGSGLRQLSRWELQRRPWTAAVHLVAGIAASRRLVRLARELRPAFVHTNTMKAHVLAVPAARLSRSRLIWHVRDILGPGWLGSVFAGLAGFVPDDVVCISRAAAQPFAHGRAASRVRVVYNGITPRRVAAAEVETWRSRLGAGPGQRVVGMVGQIARWKGQDIFVEAAHRLASKRSDVRFCIAGACLFPENEAAFERDLLDRAGQGALRDRMVVLGPVDDVDGIMAALDVAVHASRLPEPFGRVIVEAMAQGTPVVTTALGAGPELVQTGYGRIVPPDDPAALASALEELLDSAEGLRPCLADRFGSWTGDF